jgi:hypothetical protein
MSRAQLTALLAALTLGTVASHLAAQDTSSAGQARPDTSGYTGMGGVDTSASPSGVGATDTSRTTADSAAEAPRVGEQRPLKPGQPVPRLRDSTPEPPPRPTDAPGHVDASDTAGPLGATDTSGMCGRHADTTKVGDTTSAKPIPCPSGNRSEAPQPTTQPGQSTSGTSEPHDSV